METALSGGSCNSWSRPRRGGGELGGEPLIGARLAEREIPWGPEAQGWIERKASHPERRGEVEAQRAHGLSRD